ncbi:MAG: hypothetical protein CL816_05220 [Coxiellaceae bacterium]|nr:hypothetical protein [Coxiellaceae bacterium]|tara:strand:+ start:1494 stop:3290 length:1797 start_codon:yes stop_codon:yes gene_type:complete
MVKIRYSNTPPRNYQTDDWTCGYRALFAIEYPDIPFELSTVQAIKLAIVNARHENEQPENQQTPAAASGTSHNNLTQENLDKMAALLAQRCGLLKSPLSRDIDELLGDEGVVPQDEDWEKIYGRLKGNDNFKSILTWLQQNQQLLITSGATAFASFRDLPAKTIAYEIFTESHQGEIVKFCEGLNEDHTSRNLHAKRDTQSPLLKNHYQINNQPYWLQDDDIRQWCIKYSRDHALDNCSVNIATIGRFDSRLEAVFQEMSDIFKTTKRQNTENRYFVVNNNTAAPDSSQGSHWSLLKIVVGIQDDIHVTYIDSLPQNNESEMEGYVSSAIRRAWHQAKPSYTPRSDQSSKNDHHDHNQHRQQPFTRSWSPLSWFSSQERSPTNTVSIKSDESVSSDRSTQQFLSSWEQMVAKNPDGKSDVGDTLDYGVKTVKPQDGNDKVLMIHYEYPSPTDEERQREPNGAETDSETSIDSLGTEVMLRAVLNEHDGSQTVSFDQNTVTSLDDAGQFDCLIQVVLEKECMRSQKSELKLSIDAHYLSSQEGGKPAIITQDWLNKQVESFRERFKDAPSPLSITINKGEKSQLSFSESSSAASYNPRF